MAVEKEMSRHYEAATQQTKGNHTTSEKERQCRNGRASKTKFSEIMEASEPPSAVKSYGTRLAWSTQSTLSNAELRGLERAYWPTRYALNAAGASSSSTRTASAPCAITGRSRQYSSNATRSSAGKSSHARRSAGRSTSTAQPSKRTTDFAKKVKNESQTPANDTYAQFVALAALGLSPFLLCPILASILI